MTHPFVQFLSRPRVRMGLGATAAAAVVSVIALGAFTAGGTTAPRRTGPGLAVAVVPPVERAVDPGGTMDVGALSDGFDRAVLERRAAEADFAPYGVGADFWRLEDVERMPMPTLVQPEATPVQAVSETESAENPLDDGSRSFGFDRPRRDFAAERAARWAEREAASARAQGDGATAYDDADAVASSSE